MSPTPPTAGNKLATSNVWRLWIPISMLFLLIGAIPWIAESINSPPRYGNITPIALQEQLATSESVHVLGISSEDVFEFASQPQAVTVIGQLLYPRFFVRNAGLTSATPWPSYAPRDYPRLGFKLLNREVPEVVFPIKNEFGNVQGDDALILGCEREDHIEARLILFPSMDSVYLSDRGLEPCSTQD